MSGPPLQEMLNRIGQTQPRLPFGTSLGIGLAALAAVSFPGTWGFIRYFATMAHEGSHAVISSLQGFKIIGVRVNMNATGGTGIYGKGRGIPSLLSGYFGPSLFGLLAAWLISKGHSIAVLWLALALLFLLLANIRNIFGMLAVVVAGYVIYLFARHGTVRHETIAAYGIAWLLLLSGVRQVLQYWNDSDDGAKLSKLTQSTQLAFSRLWLVGALFAVFLGARLMM